MHEIIFEKKGLSIERLRLLCEVAQNGGIRAAVGDDPARQSLASRQLKELAEYVGVELCRRNGRTLEMTEAGDALAALGGEFLKKMESFLLSVRDLPIWFRLGVGDSIFQWYILPRMKEFQAAFPRIRLQSFSYSNQEIIRKVEANVLDAGIVRRSALGQTDLIVRTIGEISYRLFVPLSLLEDGGRKASELPPLRSIPFCTLTGNGEYAHAMDMFQAAFNATPALSCSSMTQMYAAVESGQYAAILPHQAQRSLGATRTVSYVLPELTAFTRQIALIYRPGATEDESMHDTLTFLQTLITPHPGRSAYPRNPPGTWFPVGSRSDGRCP